MSTNNIIRELENLYESSGNDSRSIYDLIDRMQSKEVRSLIVELLDKARKISLTGVSNLTEEDIYAILTLVKCSQSLYNYTAEYPGMSDPEYDALQECIENHLNSAVDTTAPVVHHKNITVTTHRYPSLRGTLDKIYYLDDTTNEENKVNKSRRSLNDWVQTSERAIAKTGRTVNLWDEDIYVFPKWDGVSVILEYEKDGTLKRALTRGFVETNECQDITHVFRGWRTGPITDSPKEYGEKVEAMMTNENLDKCNALMNTDYKQSRSIVSSIINSDTVDRRVRYLELVSLRTSMLNEDGTETIQVLSPKVFDYPFIQCKLRDVDLISEFAINHKEVNGLRCDGAVIYIINPEIQKLLGRLDARQKFEVAFKFTEESAPSVIKDVEFTLGLFNTINPVAKVKKVKLKGNEITNVSLGSMGRFRSLNLHKGDKVNIHYDIIPYLTPQDNNEHHGELIKAPTHCPVCHHELEVTPSYEMMCTNKKCPNRIKGRVLNYMNKMHIDGISYATIDLLYDNGLLKSILDLYKFKKIRSRIEDLPRMGARAVEKMIQEIDSHRTVPFYRLLGAIGIEGIGPKKFQAVTKKISMDEMLGMDYDDLYYELLECPGIKEKSAKKIIDGLKENEELIEKLVDILDVYEDEPEADSKFSVCFTKVRDDKIESWIKHNGGSIDDTLTKNTNILVIPMSGTRSSKVDKAEKYGIPVVTIDILQEYIWREYL